MTALVATPPTLPGLDKALEIQDFYSSCALYNELLDDSDQPPVAQEHITNLAEMFVRHNADKILGIHLIHGHFKIPEETVMLGTNVESLSLRWTKPTHIEKINPTSVHGHIFALTKDGMCAYELQEGPLPDMSKVGLHFLDEFIEYIVQNSLTNLIGLQVLGCDENSMSELILEQGTVMLNSSCIKNTVPTRITGWKFESVNGKARVCTANETHAATVKGVHQIFRAGKPHFIIENTDDLKAALAEAGVI